jgi:hypothetical protein
MSLNPYLFLSRRGHHADAPACGGTFGGIALC